MLEAGAITLSGALSAQPGYGGWNANNDPNSHGGSGAEGRIKMDAPSVTYTATASMQPLPLYRPAIVPLTAVDLDVPAGETRALYTDGYTKFIYSGDLIVREGATLTAVGSRPLLIEVGGDCTIIGQVPYTIYSLTFQ